MITVKKLESLKARVRVRKIGEIFHSASFSSFSKEYLESVLALLLKEDMVGDADGALIMRFYQKGGKEDFEDIYYKTLEILGEAKADWDIVDDNGVFDVSKRTIFEHYLYLDHLRSPYNVGSIFRNAEAFGVKKIILSPGSASPLHNRAERTSRGTNSIVEWDTEENIPELPTFALELGGEDISTFKFPKKGVCIIGSEESGVSKEALSVAEKSLGRVSIKQFGVKGSINVASATAILLNAWANSENNDNK